MNGRRSGVIPPLVVARTVPPIQVALQIAPRFTLALLIVALVVAAAVAIVAPLGAQEIGTLPFPPVAPAIPVPFSATGGTPNTTVPSATASPDGGLLPRLQRVVHDVIYLVDAATGKRVMLLPGDWPPEVIDEFHIFLTRNRQTTETPYTIRSLRATGSVQQLRVADTTMPATPATAPAAASPGSLLLTLQIDLEIATRPDSVVRVPIAMPEGAVLADSAPIRSLGRGHVELAVAPDGGYQLLLTAPPASPRDTISRNGILIAIPNETESPSDSDSETPAGDTTRDPFSERASGETSETQYVHNITLTLCFPVVVTGENECRCVVSFPNAVRSEMRLTVPMADAVPVVPRDALLLGVESRPSASETAFTIQSLKGRFEWAWHPPYQNVALERPVIVAENGTTMVRLTPSETRYEAEIPVRSLTTPMERLTVRLPAGATLDATTRHSVVHYSVRSTTPGEGGRSEEVEIVFSPPTLGPVSLYLRAARVGREGSETNWSETIGGFEVVGAEKQFGSVTVTAPSDVHTSWMQGSGVHRTPLPGDLASESAAKFDYFTVPFAIQAKVRTPQSRINVKPEHVIQIFRDRALLTSRFTFNIYGTKTDLLQIDLGSWQWIELGPSHLVDLGGVFKDAENRLYIPLRGLTEGVVDLELKAYMPWEPLAATSPKQFEFPIPMPRGDWVEPAPVAIVPADNVKLFPVVRESAYDWLDATQEASPATTHLVSHVRRFLAFRSEIPRKQQEPLIYQTSGDSPLFVAGVLYTPRRVSMVSETVIRPTETGEQVAQTIGYTVEFEPLERVTLWVPMALDQESSWRVALAGKSDTPLTISTVPGETIERNGIVFVKKSLLLAGLGYFSLTLSYPIEVIDIRQGVSIQRAVPLILPADPFPLMRSVTVEVPRGIGVTLYGLSRQAWTPRETKLYTSSYQQQRFTFLASDSTPCEWIDIQLAVDDPDALGMTIVRRIWLQTWLKDDVRTDFLALMVSTNRTSLALALPPGVANDKYHVLVNGVSVTAPLLANGEIQIPLPGQPSAEPVVIDIRYQLPTHTGLTARLDLPQFLQSALVRNVYWNIVLPTQRHLVSTPSGWTPEYRWQWNGFFWTRAPLLDVTRVDFPEDLVTDYAVSPQTNQYLFSSFSPSESAELVVLSRSVMVLLASAFVLAASLSMLYFPRLRYAGSLVLLIIATLATATIQPTLSLLAMQASVLGIVLVIVAVYFYRLFVVKRPYAVMPVGDAALSQHTPYAVIIDDSVEDAVAHAAAQEGERP